MAHKRKLQKMQAEEAASLADDEPPVRVPFSLPPLFLCSAALPARRHALPRQPAPVAYPP